MEAVLLVRYAEIHLKGLNRPFFERALMNAIRRALAPAPVKVVHEQGRIFVYGIAQDKLLEAADRLSRVFGIHSISPTYATEKDWSAVEEAATRLMRETLADDPDASHTFKVFSRRADKQFPMRSEDICKELGHTLLTRFPTLRVDVRKPEIHVGVEIRQERAFVYVREIPGAGGMPVGTNGKAMLLISGGIDSPVSTYMIAKRGVHLIPVHFFSFPYTSQQAKDKVIELARLVTKYSGRMTVNVVSFTEIQEAIRDNCPEEFFTLIMRRFMMEIAQRIAKGDGCGALITGENLGQVASQTMEAMTVIGAVVDIPIFMPLVGMDKKDIISIAREIGTLDTSILPYEDCCTVFTPKHPKTKPTLGQVVNAEKKLDREALIARALENVEKIKVTYHDEPLL